LLVYADVKSGPSVYGAKKKKKNLYSKINYEYIKLIIEH
jgi:hypothetical protein